MTAPDSRERRLGQLLVALGVAALAAFVGWFLFVTLPDVPDTDGPTILGVVLTLLAAFVGFRVGARLAGRLVATYNVAEVAVEGPITRTGDFGSIPGRGSGTPADDVVEQIRNADDDDNVDALLVKLNTPGGEVVPSDDIRNAAMAFEGPTVAYATDTCASGGYWIASGCDELWARDTSIVGSIGVIGSRVNATQFAEELGLSYERFAAGRFKDAGTPLRDIDEEERAYLQGLIDDYYQHFVERVAQGRDIAPGAIRETEARVYIGERALDLGLVDALGTREDVVDHVEGLLDREVSVAEFEPSRGLRQRLRGGAQATAYAFGAGIASRFADSDADVDVRL
ncbi:signal peptide peptidase SppA [Halomarina litorea]|uniref:signal peptide peptidase SppA n=1 Tax=Halomarina litorea TaxID=2961595 RepID=UPI0020C512B7|nr:signal peptide peptidase SppA [Halomarina sp. BCD28]